MVKNIKLNTFFFKEYEQIAEKNTYSAYVPNGNGGIWCIADYGEEIKYKNLKNEKNSEIIKSVEKINLAKIGIQKVVEKYFENNDFSIENMEKIMKISKDKVVLEKMKFQKFYENEKNSEFENLYSQVIIMIEKNNLIIGNFGKTGLILYRKNKIAERINTEIIKKIKLEKDDYLIIGNDEFWSTINENEIEEIYIDMKSKDIIEKNLNNQIKIAEKKLGKVIPFLSIFVTDIDPEENYELLKNEINKNSKKQEMIAKYMFLIAMFVFLFVSVSKNIRNNSLETVQNTDIVHKFSEKVDLIKSNLIVEAGIAIGKIEQKNIENNRNEVISKDVTVIENEKIKNKNMENLEKFQNINTEKLRNVEKVNSRKIKEKSVKNKKYNRKNLTVDNKKFKRKRNSKNDKILQLEKEIEQNWEILGRNDFILKPS